MAIALGYVATLGFAAFLVWRHDRYRQTVRDQVVSYIQRLVALEKMLKERGKDWDSAAQFVEAERLGKSGAFGPRKSA